MPFKSAAQRRLLYAKEPEVAEEFARKEKESRLTPSSFSKPADRPTGTTDKTDNAVPAYRRSKTAETKKKYDFKSAARRRMKKNGDANSSTSGY